MEYSSCKYENLEMDILPRERGPPNPTEDFEKLNCLF